LSVERWVLNETIDIRPATNADHDAIWSIFHQVVAPGDTYAIDPTISRDDAFAYWFRDDTKTYVAQLNGVVVGTYTLRPNRGGGGDHVSNASFMVDPTTRDKGVGRAMAEHCLKEARRLGYRAMQFNFVVSTNDRAIRLWQALGFNIIGTVPRAFRHPEKGLVDAYVMFREL
jgi:ribosomal protein S18 acetylase RimI-like enzyme